MAYYAALVSVVQLLEDIIPRDRYPDVFVDKKQIVSAYEKFSLLQASLEDYSTKENEVADRLVRRIRDAACQAQDIIESQISNQILGQLQELEEVNEEVDSIVEEATRIKKSHTTEDVQLNYHSSDAGSSNQAPSGRDNMVGSDEQLTTIKAQLCGESDNLQVISFVGMGGIGKTTLARNIFYDELILYYFHCRAWVTVSQDYHLEKVLRDIWVSMKPTAKNSSSGVGENILAEDIYRNLKGRRYLIIIDDMWDTKVWDDVKRIFPDDRNGSRIVLTTRLTHVAVYADRFGYLHHMQFLNEEQSWKLLREKVFAHDHCPQELEDIGRLIATNCRGLPLAIVVVAGFLSKVNKARYHWEEIARKVISAATENDEHFSKILSLSYNHLPHHLKPCFLYIGGFPEDYGIRVSKLIKLWVAEGFLKPIESKSLEEVAVESLDDLVKRNLVMITEKRADGKFKCCGIHDTLRDLCIQRAHQENFLQVNPQAIKSVRRLYIHPAYSRLIEAEECDSRVRSILCFCHSSNLNLSDFKLLRILDMLKTAFSPISS